MSEEHRPGPGGLAIGTLLAGYRCEEEIGRGGMAVVYRAYDDRLDRRVALKVLAPDLARDEIFRARFIQESRIAAATEHPHIIPVFNAGEADGMLYIAMRYVPDGDVRTLIDRLGPLPVGRATALIGQAASALDAAHARGLVHRDVKPTNMLLELSSRTSRPDHLYLSDFGLAKPSTAASGLTLTGQFFGTVDYVAPEQIQSQPLDGRTDQYALACASFEMLCGSPPFKRENGMAVISAQLTEPPPRLSERRPELPAAVDQVMAKALAKSPADRYERCLDFAEALAAASRPGPGAAVIGGEAHPATRIATPIGPATRVDPGSPAGSGTPGAGADAGAVLPAAGAAAAAAGSGTPTVLPRGPGYPNASPPTDPRFTDPRL
ncbi:MAG TPA: serine/threonine-protein kinase, partial [Streptosporangiaceae bacterium]